MAQTVKSASEAFRRYFIAEELLAPTAAKQFYSSYYPQKKDPNMTHPTLNLTAADHQAEADRLRKAEKKRKRDNKRRKQATREIQRRAELGKLELERLSQGDGIAAVEAAKALTGLGY